MFFIIVLVMCLIYLVTPAVAYCGALWSGSAGEDAMTRVAEELILNLYDLSHEFYRSECLGELR